MKIAIVFAGGISNCAYEIGFAKAILEYFDRKDILYVSSSSAGIFTGYGLCANKLDLVEWMYRHIDISNKGELFWQVFAKGLLTSYIKSIGAPEDELDIPLCFPVCYVPLASIRYYWIEGRYNKAWKHHMEAAMNYPFLKIFPNFMHGRIAIDGGAIDNIPLYPVMKKAYAPGKEGRPDLIFVLHFDARYDYRKEFPSDIPVLEVDLGICNNFEKEHYDYSSVTIGKRIDAAYEYGMKNIGRILSGGGTHETMKKAIDEIFLEEHDMRQKNFSLDRLFSLLNVVGKALRSDKRSIQNLY